MVSEVKYQVLDDYGFITFRIIKQHKREDDYEG